MVVLSKQRDWGEILSYFPILKLLCVHSKYPPCDQTIANLYTTLHFPYNRKILIAETSGMSMIWKV